MLFATQSRWAVAAILGAVSLAGADNPVIEDIAQKDSFLVVSLPNWPAAKSAFMRSPAGQLWQDKAVQDWVTRMWKDQREQASAEQVQLLDDLLDHLDDLGEPAGAIGGAWSLKKDPAAKETSDGTPAGMISSMLLLADFGANAQKAEAAIVEFLEEQAKKDRLTLTHSTVAGIEVHEIELKTAAESAEDGAASNPDDASPDPDEDPDLGAFGGLGGPDFSSLFSRGEGPIKLLLARTGGSIVVASQQDGLEHALDRLAGANRPHLTDSEDWNAAVAQHPRGGHLFCCVFINDSMRELLRGAGGGLSQALPLPVEEMGLGFDKIVATLGLAPVRAISLGARFDAEAGGTPVFEQTLGVLLKEKAGLFTLLDGEGAAFEPPQWIGADVAGVGRFNLRFDRIVPLLEQIVKTLPPDLQGIASGGVQFVKSSFGPAFEAMGPELYLVDTLARPLSARSESRVVAIKVRDELTVANATSGIAAQIGLEPRDFQGAQIYESEDRTLGAGLGFGWLFIGEPTGVESAMRRAANPAEAGQPLAGSDRFRRAVAAANASGVGLIQSWTDDQQSIEYAIWSAQNPAAIMRAQWEQMDGLDAADIDELMQGIEHQVPAWVRDVPSIDLFKKYIDSGAFSMRSTPDGFRATYSTLPPRKP